MKYDLIIAGVGGQGILSLSTIIASAAMDEGLHTLQSEIHGMAQRGGAVMTHLRIADQPIHSALISTGTADMILAMEPVESLRYLDCLSPKGILLAASEPVVNIPDYPSPETIRRRMSLVPQAHMVEAGELARQSGSPRSANVVMVGAAAVFLPILPETLRSFIISTFRSKGQQVVEANLRAFEAGMEVLQCVPQ
jgi:indolepyruvate ferredoxin oxidoreductase beta subunit